MEKPRVKCEIRDGIAEVMLARGDKLNALDRAMFSAIDESTRAAAPAQGVAGGDPAWGGAGLLRRAGCEIHAQAAGGGARDLKTRGR